MKWNLRMAAARRDIWKSSELKKMLADAGLVISDGKMSHLWSGQPVTIRLDDLEIICQVLDCAPNDLLVIEPRQAQSQPPQEAHHLPDVIGGGAPIHRKPGWTAPPL